jgi:hypothetical protein
MELASMYDDSSIPIMGDLGQYNHDLDFPGGGQGVGDTQVEVAAPTNQSASIEVPPRPKSNGLLDWTLLIHFLRYTWIFTTAIFITAGQSFIVLHSTKKIAGLMSCHL